MRLAVATLLAVLTLASPAFASSVTITSVTLSPSSAAGARTVYRVNVTTSANGALSGAQSLQVTLPHASPAPNWVGGTLRSLTRSQDVGTCSNPNGNQTATCTLFSGSVVNANENLQVILRGITNPAVGSYTLTAKSTTDTQDAVSPAYQIVSRGSITKPSVTIGTPSPAAGAQTNYVIGFTLSADGGMSSDAGSAIT